MTILHNKEFWKENVQLIDQLLIKEALIVHIEFHNNLHDQISPWHYSIPTPYFYYIKQLSSLKSTSLLVSRK